jgi:RNA polymerase sigma-70 factor (ECF subfamily)
MCRDEEDAKDVVQDTLLAAARGVREFRGASSISTWLYAIARSACVKKRRHATVETVSLDDDTVMEVAAPAADPAASASERELGNALEEAIAALAPAYREILLLRDVEGVSAADVATIVGIGVPAVKSRLHRARLAVRERLLPLLSTEMPASVGCPDIAPVLSRYLEGEIGPNECAKMEAHVEACARCLAECDSLRKVLSLCQTAGRGGAVSPEIEAAVRRAVAQLVSD